MNVAIKKQMGKTELEFTYLIEKHKSVIYTFQLKSK